jgi:hypothetical protein
MDTGQRVSFMTFADRASADFSDVGNMSGDKHDNFKRSTKRFKDRFAEICNDLDSMIVRCRITVEEVTYARELFMDELARQEAEESKHQNILAALEEARLREKNREEEAKKTNRQARIGTGLAFVAMLYLPATSLATIFAMPVLKFDNGWWDAQFRDVPSGGNSGGGDGPGRPSPVFSAYFWIYLLISAAFTMVTLLAWHVHTKEPKRGSNEVGVEDKSSFMGGVARRMGDSPIGARGGSSSAGSRPLVDGRDTMTRRRWKLFSVLGGHDATKKPDLENG